MKTTDVKLTIVDAQLIMRRNFEVQRRGFITESGLLKSFFGSIHKCQEYLPNSKLILLFDKKIYDENSGKAYYYKTLGLPEYKGDRHYTTDEEVNDLKEKITSEDLTEEEKKELIILYTKLEKDLREQKIFNFSKYKVINGIYGDTDRYSTNFISFQQPGLEADDIAYILSLESQKRGIPTALYTSDSDWIGFTNETVAFVPPVNLSDSMKKKRSGILKEVKELSNRFNLPRHTIGVLKELFESSHNAVPCYHDNVDKKVTFEEFSRAMLGLSEIDKCEEYKTYFNSLMMEDYLDKLDKEFKEKVYNGL